MLPPPCWVAKDRVRGLVLITGAGVEVGGEVEVDDEIKISWLIPGISARRRPCGLEAVEPVLWVFAHARAKAHEVRNITVNCCFA